MTTGAMLLSGRRRREGWHRLASYALLGATGVDGVVCAASGDDRIESVCFALAGVACIGGLLVGLRRLSPNHARPWWLVLGAAALFLAGGVWRSTPPSGAGAYAPDVLSMLGYGCLSGALFVWLRRAGTGTRWALADALLVAVGASMAAWALLLVPTLGMASVSDLRRGVYAAYPVLDVVLMGLLLRLALMRLTRFPAFWMLSGGISLVLAGDVVYSLAVSGVEIGPQVALSIYVLAYGSIGAAVLHPSAERLSEPQTTAPVAWNHLRLVGVGVALLTPAVLMMAVPAESLLDRCVRGVLAASLTTLVIYRTAQAVNAYARSEQRARHRASHDDLTGLPNRLQLNEVLESLMLRAQLRAGDGTSVASLTSMPHAEDRDGGADTVVSLLFLDLDGFKLINDSFGHGVGDELLVAAATRVREAVRPDDFVARLGGDEFIIVACHLDATSGEGLAERLIEAFAEPFVLSTGAIFVSPSIGIAQSSASASVMGDAESLLRDADAAMYKAKAEGRNRAAVFDESLQHASRQRIESETGLRNALDQSRFELHYQPVVRMSDRVTIGHEALLRWRHPEKGMISPADFIAIAEDTWLIVPIGAWVLREALRQLTVWRATSPELSVAVNVSARQLRDPAFPTLVSEALRSVKLPGSALCLELTEYALVDDTPVTELALTAIRALGVTIAVDDFGTGYSALGYLKRLPVATVKIDRSFVEGLGRDSDDEALVRAVLAMAQALGLTVIAEGVETEVQAAVLADMGCAYAQGWLYGRPCPAEVALPADPKPALIQH